MKVALFAVGEKHYQLSLVQALIKQGIKVDLICNDEIEENIKINSPNLMILNLRGLNNGDANIVQKVFRIITYYIKIVDYAIHSDADIFHIQWDNKFKIIDRILLLRFYHLIRKKVVYTAHNADNHGRVGKNPWMNRVTLKYLYKNVDGIITHTEITRDEICKNFFISDGKIKVIHHGINNQIPRRGVKKEEARKKLMLIESDKVILFFGGIELYKGLHILLDAFSIINKKQLRYKLIIAGRSKNADNYIKRIKGNVEGYLFANIIENINYIEDNFIEEYFVAADCVVLPYLNIYQSGVLFIALSFGTPIIASDVGNFRNDIIEGFSGFVYKPNTSESLAKKIIEYFECDLFFNLASYRNVIINYANEKYSWEHVGKKTVQFYSYLVEGNFGK